MLHCNNYCISLYFSVYSEAAVSITVTSLTDFLSFMCGSFTPFPSVRIFCLYSGVSVLFIYVWHVTLFGAFLVSYSIGKKILGFNPM